MTLADTANGPDWIVWAVVIVIAILSAALLSGHGSWLIAGYNTASEKERKKYDKKKLCRTVGAGLAVADVIILIMELFEMCSRHPCRDRRHADFLPTAS